MHQVKVEQFEGPLDLLLSLIESSKLDVTQISLAKITDEYIDCITKLKKDNRQIAEFVLIASKLLYIKSKTILPSLTNPEEEEEIEDLERKLEEYKRYKEAAKYLEDMLEKSKRSFRRQEKIKFQIERFVPPEGVDVNLLASILSEVLKRLPKEELEKAEKIIERKISVEEKIQYINDHLKKKKKLSFKSILSESKSKHEIIISFLAVLDLLKQKIIQASQDNSFSDIIITVNNAKS